MPTGEALVGPARSFRTRLSLLPADLFGSEPCGRDRTGLPG